MAGDEKGDDSHVLHPEITEDSPTIGSSPSQSTMRSIVGEIELFQVAAVPSLLE